MLKRTPLLGLLFALLLSAGVVALVQVDGRPFTQGQLIGLFCVAYLPGLGFAMLFDPYSAKKKAEYLAIDFYHEDED